MPADYLLVYVTVPGLEDGERLAEILVGEKLAACVNVVADCRSIYRWQGEISRDSEAMMVIKTRGRLFDALSARVTSLHAYDVPEIIAVPLVSISTAYEKFLDDNL